MSFANLPLWGVLAGVAALAGTLFLLQLLRVRHVEVAVPSTLFWRAAAREAPVRVLRGAFRHPLAYLLVLAICTLLWLAFAGPEAAEDRTATFRVLFLDGSAHVASGDDFQRAVDAVKADLAGMPEGRREVIWGGARNLKLLKAGEDRLMLDRRLEALAAEAAPSALNEQLRLLALPGAAPDALEFVVYGRAPADAAVVDNLPPGFQVSRAIDYPEAPSNRGVVALGVNTAASGSWDRVDLLIRTAGTQTSKAALAVEIDGQPLDDAHLEWLAEDVVVVRDLPADGRTVQARIQTADGLAVDDAARLTLPVREVVRIALVGDPDPAIRRAIEADPGLEVATDNAAVVVRPGGSSAFAGLPALEFAAFEDQANAFELGYTGDDSAEHALRASIAALGLDQIDAAGLATDAKRPVGVELRHAESPAISVWNELLVSSNFTASRSFPLFVSRAARWLAGESTWLPYLAAGRPLPSTGAPGLLATPDPLFDALGAEYVLGAAGTITAADGGTRAVALLSDPVTELHPGVPLAASQAGGGLSGTGTVTWLILAALLLLGAEWFIHQRGLMP